ncbi:MAG TPA: kynureninase [Gammaproteobacteria bacterium]|jgi:kynureninase
MTTFGPGIDYAAALDSADTLAQYRRAFDLPHSGKKGLVYLCGHSLGPLPKSARRAVEVELERWAELGVEAHFDGEGPWYSYHERFAAPLARLVGAHADEVVAMNSLTVNLHLMLATFYRPKGKRTKIVVERGAFPSDRYAVQSQLRQHGLDPKTHLIELEGTASAGAHDRKLIETGALELLLAEHADEIALVLLPGVQFLTGQALALDEFARIAQRYDCRIGFDLAHAVGNVPLALHDAGADFAVWCSYKYLNAGPGAIGGCFVHRRWHGRADTPRLAGWWGHDAATRFALRDELVPMPGAQAWQLSNPSILAMAPLAASLAIFEAATLRALRKKSVRLTAYLERLLEHELGERIRILTPRDANARGAQLSVRVNVESQALDAVRAALRAAGVVVDWRGDDVLRMAPAPLYNRYRDVHAAVQALGRALARA